MGFLSDPIGWILSGLSQLLYFLESCCYALLDLAQLMFRIIAGLDTLNGDTVGGDLFYQIIRRTFFAEGGATYSVIAIAFWSIMILSCILLFITTIAAIIKSEVAVGKDGKFDNSKGKIIADSIKALIFFAIVPISCYFGLWLGNAVLFAVDKATSPQTTSITSLQEGALENLATGDSGSYNYYIFWGTAQNTTYTSMSGMINKICLYQANRIRNDDAFFEMIVNEQPIVTEPTDPDEGDTDGNAGEGNTGEVTDPSIQTPPVVTDGTYNFGIITQENSDVAASVVDELFMFNAKLKTPQVLNSYDYISAYGNASGSTVKYFDRSNIALVSYFYDLTQYNHILAVLFIFTGGKVLLTLSFAVMHRIIMLLAMMFVEPITLSFMPLDKGNAFGEWRKSFVSNVISLYILVLAVNVFYIITPVFQTFTFFGDVLGVLSWADMVVQAAFIIAALMAIQAFEASFSKMLGGASIMEAGSKMMESTIKSAKAVGGVALAAAGIGLGVAGAAAHVGAAGVKAGLGIKNAVQVHRAKGRMAGNENAANRSNDQIRNDLVERTQNEATNEYNKDIDTAYSAYAQAHPNGSAKSRDEWLASDEGRTAVEKNRARFGGMSAEEYAASEGERVSNAISSGVATNDKDREAINNYQNEVRERDEARKRYDEAKESRDKHREVRNKRFKGALDSSIWTFTRSGKRIVSSVGNMPNPLSDKK